MVTIVKVTIDTAIVNMMNNRIIEHLHDFYYKFVVNALQNKIFFRKNGKNTKKHLHN
jgi:hypothetical protein